MVLTCSGLCPFGDRSSITAGRWWSVTCFFPYVGTYRVSVHLSYRPARHIKVLQQEPAGNEGAPAFWSSGGKEGQSINEMRVTASDGQNDRGFGFFYE